MKRVAQTYTHPYTPTHIGTYTYINEKKCWQDKLPALTVIIFGGIYFCIFLFL